MIAFATGGLLGDVCLHLIPHSFMGESGVGEAAVRGDVRFVMVEEKRNIIIGVSPRRCWQLKEAAKHRS